MMAFTIEPNLDNIFNVFTQIEFQGVDHIWGGLLALLLIIIISTEAYHMKITALPMVIFLHFIGIYQHMLVFLVALVLFVTTALTFKMLKGGVESIAGFTTQAATTAYDIAGTAKDTMKYRGFGKALTVRSSAKELKDAERLALKESIVDAKPEQIADFSKGEMRMLEKLSPIQKKRLIEKKLAEDRLDPLIKRDKNQAKAAEDFALSQLQTSRNKLLDQIAVSDDMDKPTIEKQKRLTKKEEEIRKKVMEGIDYV